MDRNPPFMIWTAQEGDQHEPLATGWGEPYLAKADGQSLGVWLTLDMCPDIILLMKLRSA
eukprot:scaffold149180_cov29-Prasinocladus_malaysianus.AAC.1